MSERDDEPSSSIATTWVSDPRSDATLWSAEPQRAARDERPLVAVDRARYRGEAVLGLGGMGEVRLCHDEVIGRDVALKRMLDEVRERPRARARFAREALIQARLEHPSIVPVYDVGLADDDGPWFTMKRIRGRSLDSILRSAREGDPESVPSRRKLLTSFVQVCLAVDYAHRRGVIHRDLKPGNVMLGEFGEVHLLDWGLAKVRGESSAEPLDLAASEDDATVTGSLMGTPGYMSPEQARGATDHVDGRADVYALGAILFELLTLEPLVPGQSTISLLSATMQGMPRSRFDREELPPELAEACARATETEPEDRLPSARALAELVERYLDGDRDVQLRGRLAGEHFERAKRHLSAASTTAATEAARADALRELGRVVALDPTNAAALDLMTHLLVEPSATDAVPPDVEPELERSRDDERRRAASSAARRYLLWCVFVPVLAVMGVQHLPTVIAIGVLVASSALVAAFIARTRPVSAPLAALLFATSSLAIAFTAGVFGPFVLVPGLAATNTMFFALHADARHRVWVTLAGVLAIVLPFALDALGLTPPAYSFSVRGLQLEERIVALPETTTTITLLLTSTLLVAVPTLMIARMRDALGVAERRLTTQAWRLRQMLPAGTRELLARGSQRPPK
ncbi:serine/threonine-protein kinase [Sandaracinus amylolyticus]|uniref:serine/threonine-protein kinase n=1 Tax=Sandaracinus amylolyticus TaxID=927083 RepID=UPI001F20DC75|nr:serine/threonine-protein kinase [Sandaracinus amylolyticus]UJR83286.1 Hypothetical protein I5071_53540 [Sandaracinus amylolyticus]